MPKEYCGGMRFSRLINLPLILLIATNSAVLAGPYPKDEIQDTGFSFLQSRQCASYCGAQNQFCCNHGEACFTNQANIAFCSAGMSPPAGYEIFTTTFTETNLVLRTSTFTSWGTTPTVLAAPTITPPAICTTSLGESSCGTICCASNQRCAFANSCTAHVPAAGDPTYSVPVRPTSGDLFTISATTTVPFQPAATASGSSFPEVSQSYSNGLSGGAIAGIVIGVTAGIALIILLCFCCLVKSGFKRILAKFCFWKRKGRSDRVSENQSRINSQTSPSDRREKTGFKDKLTAIISFIADILGLKSKKNRSDVSTSYCETNVSGYFSESHTGTSMSQSDIYSQSDASRYARR
ncbi:BgTH12-05550 [Blumeria graminis f. sp. triticale]|uniref:BgTH12-05550 n=1 Tax=Blumeria graminis f. sp. triticale TaxID=1689686 RepID=A0A9W4D9I8_BLUGR|nr:BgTH12-05550 [Blumeria graminis f. sp. triticale]